MTGSAALRVGTRASVLATTQSRLVADALKRALGRDIELVEVTTHGDTTTAPLASLGGVGVFVNALREALLLGKVDIAVHSLKDLPTGPHTVLALAAVPLGEAPGIPVVTGEELALGESTAGPRFATGS